MWLTKFLVSSSNWSRRAAEELLKNKRVTVNGILVDPVTKVTEKDVVKVDGKVVSKPIPRLWKFHKLPGLITSHSDELNRTTVFDYLKKNTDLPNRVVSVGRLDYNSEGLLLVTNNPRLSHFLENPKSGLSRSYRVRVFGQMNPTILEEMEKGLTIDQIRYKPIKGELLRDHDESKLNTWVQVHLQEGKNREIRKIFEHFNLKVNRLIRTNFGPFELGELQPGKVEEVHNFEHIIEEPEKDSLDKIQKVKEPQTKTMTKGIEKNKMEKKKIPSDFKERNGYKNQERRSQSNERYNNQEKRFDRDQQTYRSRSYSRNRDNNHKSEDSKKGYQNGDREGQFKKVERNTSWNKDKFIPKDKNIRTFRNYKNRDEDLNKNRNENSYGNGNRNGNRNQIGQDFNRNRIQKNQNPKKQFKDTKPSSS